MRTMMIAFALALASATLAGCSGRAGGPTGGLPAGEPRIDASTDEALDASIRRISDSLSEASRKEFSEDCRTVMGPELMKAVFRNAYEAGDRKPGPKRSPMYRSVDGLTAPQVHARALEMRAVGEEEKAKMKASDERKVAKAKEQQALADAEVRKAEQDRVAQRLRAEAEQAARRSPEAVARRAAEEIRRAAEGRFGAEAARAATITADAATVKAVGDNAWDVSGQFVGPDRGGATARLNWVARIGFTLGQLQCVSLALGDRPPAAGPSASAKAAPGASMPPGKSKAPVKPKARPQSPAERAAAALKRGQALEEAGRPDEALTIYQDVVKSYPDTPSAEKAGERADALLGRPKKK